MLFHVADGLTGLEQQAGVGVSEIVEPDTAQLGEPQDAITDLEAKVFGVSDLAASVGEGNTQIEGSWPATAASAA